MSLRSHHFLKTDGVLMSKIDDFLVGARSCKRGSSPLFFSLNDRTPAEVAKIKFPFRNWADVVISQAPIPQAVQSDDRIIVSTDFQGAEKLKKVHKRRVRKQHRMREVIPTASEVKGVR